MQQWSAVAGKSSSMRIGGMGRLNRRMSAGDVAVVVVVGGGEREGHS